MKLFHTLKRDIWRTSSLIDGSRPRKLLSCFRSPGVQAAVTLRFGQWLLKRNLLAKVLLTHLYGILFHWIRTGWGIEIPRRARIGEGLYIGHFGGIIVSPEAIIGKNLTISQNVTIGESGQSEKAGCPIIGDNVYIAPGAKISGKMRIGDNAKIGANAVIYKDIPDNAIVVLSPGFQIISYKGNRPNNPAL
jgi:serine O-acetyltransferase